MRETIQPQRPKIERVECLDKILGEKIEVFEVTQEREVRDDGNRQPNTLGTTPRSAFLQSPLPPRDHQTTEIVDRRRGKHNEDEVVLPVKVKKQARQQQNPEPQPLIRRIKEKQRGRQKEKEKCNRAKNH